MAYILKKTHYNSSAPVFFMEAPENAILLADKQLVFASIYYKHGIDYAQVSVAYGQEPDGTHTRIETQPFESVEAAESFFNDVSNSPFWQTHMFAWNRDNGVKGRFEITDEAGNLVKLLHDNRGITVSGEGPTAWAPYVPA